MTQQEINGIFDNQKTRQREVYFQGKKIACQSEGWARDTEYDFIANRFIYLERSGRKFGEYPDLPAIEAER